MLPQAWRESDSEASPRQGLWVGMCLGEGAEKMRPLICWYSHSRLRKGGESLTRQWCKGHAVRLAGYGIQEARKKVTPAENVH